MAKTILVVDDNPTMRKLLCRILEVEQHYEVCSEAATGEEAIRAARGLKPDVVVLDFSMPGMNGLETARNLKSILPAVPIILCTQFADAIPVIPDSPFDRIVEKSNVVSLMRHIRELART